MSALAIQLAVAAVVAMSDPVVERVTTRVPFPRGLAVVDGDLYVLCRGRVRGAGGVSAAVEDQAGTIYVVDPAVTEPVDRDTVGDPVRTNGTVFARPTEPPFRLWDRSSQPPWRDRFTDRPYCTLRYDDATRSFYVCAFSGIDKPATPQDPVAFSKNLTDALLRYDVRTRSWHEVERHDIEAGGSYPHHDPATHAPPAGWLNGPDNCLVLGAWLYAVAKDNSVLVRYDLGELQDDPHAGPPVGTVVLDEHVHVRGAGTRALRGPSALAFRDGRLYVGYRTTSEIIRIRLDERYLPVEPIVAEVVARFDPFDPATGHSANITDMDFDEAGRLYAISAQPARVYRFSPDPRDVYDARDGARAPWVDLAEVTGNPHIKGENVLWHDGRLYVTSGDGYADAAGATGTVFRVRP